MVVCRRFVVLEETQKTEKAMLSLVDILCLHEVTVNLVVPIGNYSRP
jgi:hypothetical protein